MPGWQSANKICSCTGVIDLYLRGLDSIYSRARANACIRVRNSVSIKDHIVTGALPCTTAISFRRLDPNLPVPLSRPGSHSKLPREKTTVKCPHRVIHTAGEKISSLSFYRLPLPPSHSSFPSKKSARPGASEVKFNCSRRGIHSWIRVSY